MLEYCLDTSLQWLSEKELYYWTGLSQSHKYLILLRSCRVLEYCPTLLTVQEEDLWLYDDTCQRLVKAELGLPATSTFFHLRRRLKVYLDTPWPFHHLTYHYRGLTYVLRGELTMRKFWQSQKWHMVLMTVDPHTMTVYCRDRQPLAYAQAA